ncbi:MAG: Pr6Pr family membrane protein [Bifidobacteriaceae bacterium]|jgi:hypothetical protein|nr:Pr6Pr family membrane protein [Bifidobacteriaceae bacterium]
MAIASRPFALVFRLVAVVLIVTGLARLIGFFGPGPGPSWSTLVFYTTQSNVLCLIWMITMTVVTVRAMARGATGGAGADQRPNSVPRPSLVPWPRLGAMVMMAITVTMLIYLVVLAPTFYVQGDSGYKPFTLTDDLIHIVTPCLTIADWFLFAPKGRLRLWDPVLWAIPPYTYLLFTVVWPALGGDFGDGRRYPYPFLDVQELGLGRVLLGLLVMTVALVAFGYLFVAADKLAGRAARKRAASRA